MGSLLLEVLRPSDWFKVLVCVGDANENGETPTAVEVSARTGLSTDAVCRCFAYLESRGLIE
jgi:hypothetical protein